MRPLDDAKGRKEWVGALCKNRRSFQCNCVNQVTVFKFLVYSVNNTCRSLFYVKSLWVNLISLIPLDDANARKEWVGALCKNRRSFQCTIASENDLLILTAYCFGNSSQMSIMNKEQSSCSTVYQIFPKLANNSIIFLLSKIKTNLILVPKRFFQFYHFKQ